jgi:hypothetical protein
MFSFDNPTPDGEPRLSTQVEPKYIAQIIVSNNNVFLEFVRLTLMAVGTRFLKVMCKSFIKAIDPNKRSTYPYSKSNPAPGEPQTPRYPPWWPSDVRFKEPDHLIQPECERLIAFMLIWCLNDVQFREKGSMRTLWKNLWKDDVFTSGSDQRTIEERNKKIYMLEQLQRIAAQREAFLNDEIGKHWQIYS